MMGACVLFLKELKRLFGQSQLAAIWSPILLSALYLVIFSSFMPSKFTHLSHPVVHYLSFLVPGLLVLMAVQNAFMHSSTCIVVSKITGSIIFILLAPIGSLGLLCAFVGVAIVRAFVVALGILVVAHFSFSHVSIVHGGVVWSGLFLSALCAGTWGLMVGLWATNFDQQFVWQNFVITPASILSGTFFSPTILAPKWHTLIMCNPCVYMVDYVRYGFTGYAEMGVMCDVWCVSGFSVLSLLLCVCMLKSGYKLKP